MNQIRDYANQKLYRRNHEAQEMFRAAQPELDISLEKIVQIFDNTRVSLADIKGIEMWERIYGISPNLIMDTLEDRRERILEAMRTMSPFTETWLQGDLHRDGDIQGQINERFPDGEVIVDLRGLRMDVLMDIEAAGLNEKGFTRRDFREFLQWVRGWIPSNVLLMTTAIYHAPKVEDTVYFAGHHFLFSETTLLHPPHQEIVKADVVKIGSAHFIYSETNLPLARHKELILFGGINFLFSETTLLHGDPDTIPPPETIYIELIPTNDPMEDYFITFMPSNETTAFSNITNGNIEVKEV